MLPGHGTCGGRVFLSRPCPLLGAQTRKMVPRFLYRQLSRGNFVGILVTPSSAIRLIYATRLMDWANIRTLLWCTRAIRASVGIAREYSPHGHLPSFSHSTSSIFYLTNCVQSQSRLAIAYNLLSGKFIFVHRNPHAYSNTCKVSLQVNIPQRLRIIC